MLFSKGNLNKLQKKQDSDSKKHTILIVDDEKANLRLLEKILENDYDLILQDNGFEALELIKKLDNPEKISLIISDHKMPKMNGITFLAESISLLPLSKRIILTAYSDPEDIIEAVNKAQIYKFISKPFSNQGLLLTVKRALETYDLEAQTVKLNKDLSVLNADLEKKVLERTKELEEKTQIIINQDKEKRELFHVLCHDLSNPIASTLSAIECIKEDPEVANEMLNLVEVSMNNSLDLIDLVKRLQEFDEKKMELEVTSTSLKSLIEESLSVLNYKLKEKAISVSCEFESDLKIRVERISFVHSVFNNLLTNAIKFSFSGSNIEISAYETGNRILLKVKDHGIGMSNNLLKNLFNISKHTSRPGTNQEAGTGFGMPLVKKFISSYGGEIEVFSQEKVPGSQESGTEIRLYLLK